MFNLKDLKCPVLKKFQNKKKTILFYELNHWEKIYVIQVRDVEAIVRRFKTDLHNCVGYIQEPKMLKESIKALYQKHVQEDIVRMPHLCLKKSDTFIFRC